MTLNKTLLSKIFMRSAQPMVLTSSTGTVLALNDAFTDLTGYTSKDLVGKPPLAFNFKSRANQTYEDLEQALVDTGVWEGETLEKRIDGEAIPCWVKIERIDEKDDKSGSFLYLGSLKDLSDDKLVERNLYRASNYDLLTRIPNRNLFLDHLRKNTYDANINKGQFAIICLDLDQFKSINESYGMRVADDILLIVGDRLLRNFAENSQDKTFIARIGGNEFAIFVNNLYSKEEMFAYARQVQNVLAEPFNARGKPITLTCSCGVSHFPSSATDADELMRSAQHALSIAKESGNSSVVFYDHSMAKKAQEQMQISSGLRRAATNNEFELYIQPKFSSEKKLTSAEALLRWNDPVNGIIGPDKFIPILEESDLIHEVGQWVVDEACKLATKIHALGLKDFKIAVNISQKQFEAFDFYKNIMKVLSANGFDGDKLELELTESTIAQSPDFVAETLGRLRKAGISIAIDDFGTGFSSLASLSHFPLDTLKIDRAFIKGIGAGKNSENIISTIVAIAEALNLNIVAEGVETERQLKFVLNNNIDEIQGFYFSKPLPYQEFIDYISSLGFI